MTAYETCWHCAGSGMQDYGDTIGTCSYCHGDCVIRARDDKGRFTTTGAHGNDAVGSHALDG